MKKSIYNVYVVMDNQETCDKMKQLCIDNGLQYWNHESGFNYLKNSGNYFECNYGVEFGVYDDIIQNRQQVTESEFIELLKTTK